MLDNPFGTKLSQSPENAEKARIDAVLSDYRFAARKLEFAKLFYERPGESPFYLISQLFTDPSDTANVLTLAMNWPTDPEVLRYMDHLSRPGNAHEDALPDKEGLAMRLMRLADNRTIAPEVRLKAMAQYQTLMGMDPPKAPPTTGGNVTNIIDARRMFVLPANLSPDDWERKNSPSKQIELTANDNPE